jgi:hypothetical protein
MAYTYCSPFAIGYPLSTYSPSAICYRLSAIRMPRKSFPIRLSAAPRDASLINNLPGRYETENWRAHYWDVRADGELHHRHCELQLPRGGDAIYPRIQIGELGIIKKVRPWGVTLAAHFFEALAFDPLAYLTHDTARYPRGDDDEIVDVVLRAANFDLPAEFIIASDEHPFLLFGPSGELKGSYLNGHSYLGALAYYVTQGRNTAPMNTMRELDRDLYERAVKSMLGELRKMRGA